MKYWKKILVMAVCGSTLIFGGTNSTFATSEYIPYYSPQEMEFLREQKEIDNKQIQMVLEQVQRFEEEEKLTSFDTQSYKIMENNTGSTTSLGTYGDIIVSLIADSGSVGFAGHAAIVSNNNWETIESYAKNWSPIKKDGVQRYNNNWGSQSGTLLYRPKGATDFQYRKAATYAEKQIGKPYNWQFWDKNTTDKFYCSQLVWRAWLEAGIDTEVGSIPNGIIAPADLANSSNTYLVKKVQSK